MLQGKFCLVWSCELSGLVSTFDTWCQQDRWRGEGYFILISLVLLSSSYFPDAKVTRSLPQPCCSNSKSLLATQLLFNAGSK